MRQLAALAVAITLLAPASTTALPGPGVIRVTATSIRHFIREGDNTRVFLLYNRPSYPVAIGNAILSCDFVGRGGPLSRGTTLCEAVYALAKGKITASGLIKSRLYYIMAITGGTGIYSNVRGEVVGTKIGTSSERLLFSLEV